MFLYYFILKTLKHNNKFKCQYILSLILNVCKIQIAIIWSYFILHISIIKKLPALNPILEMPGVKI